MLMHLVGKITLAKGLGGEVVLRLFGSAMDWQERLETLSLGWDQDTPSENFTVERWAWHRQGLTVKLAGVANRNQAEELRGRWVFVPDQLLVAKPGEVFFLKEILGFRVFNGDQLVGAISGFSSNGPQDLLVVQQREGAVEIPLVKEFLREVDFSSAHILMRLPPGLLEAQR
ncbi:MAG: 16S rRNA processing protein RimM [Bdellovibrio sp.]|nr:MAG: 16S rRNA processing protein RimM [Bdellovibrio sp.]